MRQRSQQHDHLGGGALVSLAPGERATVCSVCPELDPSLAARLADLGFYEGAEVEHVRTAPLGDPAVYRVCDTEICLRRAQASCILVDAPRVR